ncbi:MAG: hypothetical protein JWN00_1698 [Actinomycetia bacterium]|nr:hypothetical protein [Actinomycetes bacterium]
MGDAPAQIDQVARREQLGDHRAAYLPVLGSTTQLQVAGVIAAVAILAGLYGLVTANVFLVTFGMGFGGIIGYRTIRIARLNGRKKGQRLDLYEHGLALVAHAGQVAFYRWDRAC